MKTTMQYFGTAINSVGHYFYLLKEGYMYQNKGYYEQVVKTIGFDPESLPKYCNRRGQYEFHYINGYSILAILGSCSDTRPGSKSVFFIEGSLTEEELIQSIKSDTAAMLIIYAMPFDVQGLNTKPLNNE